jgi:hypothetical protein
LKTISPLPGEITNETPRGFRKPVTCGYQATTLMAWVPDQHIVSAQMKELRIVRDVEYWV